MAIQKFTSERSWLVGSIIWGAVLLLLVLLAREFWTSGFTVSTGVVCLLQLAVLGLLLWFWFGTRYTLDGSTLFYTAGPVHGSIDVHRITRIKTSQRLWSGLRPALGFHGVVVCYNRWDEIYLSPKDKERFIAQLRAVNEAIVVEG